MVKKFLLLVLQVIGCIAFFACMLSCGMLRFYPFYDSAFYYLYIPLAPVFLIPAFKKHPINGYAVVVAALFILEGSTQIMDRFRGHDQFNYKLGNTTGPLRVIFQHDSTQGLMSRYQDHLPEDEIRFKRMKSFVQNDFEVYRDILIRMQSSSPLDTIYAQKAYERASELLAHNKSSIAETNIQLFELAGILNVKTNLNKDSLFTIIDQQLAAGSLTQREAVALKLRIHQFSTLQ